MSVEHGPLRDDKSERGISWWLSGKMMSVFFTGLNQIAFPFRFNADRNRISIHGESQNPGSEMKAGMFSALVPMISLLFYSGVFVLLGPTVDTVSQFSMVAANVVSVPFVILGLLLIASFSGHFQRMRQMRVVDHTTEPLPDELDDLKQQFVDGDLDDTEFEAQLEDRLTEVDR